MDYFEISNKEKIESQLFGDGISEEEVINELSQQLEEMPATDALATTKNPDDAITQIENESDTKNDIEIEADVIEASDIPKSE